MFMMGIGLVGWIFLAVAAASIALGLYTLLGDVNAMVEKSPLPYTKESMIASCRWGGLSSIAFGLGVAGYVLLTKTLFDLGLFSVTVGLAAFLVMFLLSHRLGRLAKAALVPRETVLDCDMKIN